jgi:hypothetical protein
MYIHIGSKKILSLKNIVGIFNAETIKSSEECFMSLENDTKSVIVETRNEIHQSEISSFTLIKRNTLKKEECIWTRSAHNE